ncbi:hypothetical protein GCM10020367_64230 [Streptomyces sannanensis]|uniref:Integrase n=1 Tax=Streptomyces sannanensis TaxID=285536 RepID=A0ABP6SM71_9ACTN
MTGLGGGRRIRRPPSSPRRPNLPPQDTVRKERLRVRRRLEEVLPQGADPLHLALVLGIDEKTTIRYAQSARVLLDEAAEQHSQ